VYEKYFHNTGVGYSYLLTTVIALMLQFLGQWSLMIIAGALGCVFVKRHSHAFIAGFLGVAVAWSLLFAINVALFQGYEIAEFFAILIGAAGSGRYIVSLSILIGGFLEAVVL